MVVVHMVIWQGEHHLRLGRQTCTPHTCIHILQATLLLPLAAQLQLPLLLQHTHLVQAAETLLPDGLSKHIGHAAVFDGPPADALCLQDKVWGRGGGQMRQLV